MSEKDKAFVRGLLEISLIFIVIPTFLFGFPTNQYHSIGEWWTTGQAQLTATEAKQALDKFYGDDAIGNLFKATTLLIVKTFVPIWNTIASFEVIKYAAPIILSGLIYDLCKTALKNLYTPKKPGTDLKNDQP